MPLRGRLPQFRSGTNDSDRRNPRPGDDLGRAKLAFVPHLAIWDSRWTASITKFVEAGGTLIVGARTGTRDEHNHVLTSPAPGPLAELCGVRVGEFGRIPAVGASSILAGSVFQVETTATGRVAESARRKHSVDLGSGEPVEAGHVYELLEPADGTNVVGRWAARFLKGQAAITRRQVGSGSVIYVGTYLTHALVGQLFDPLFAEYGIAPPFAVPAGVEVTTRSAPDRTLTFVQNTTADTVDIDAPGGAFRLQPYGSTMLTSSGIAPASPPRPNLASANGWYSDMLATHNSA